MSQKESIMKLPRFKYNIARDNVLIHCGRFTGDAVNVAVRKTLLVNDFSVFHTQLEPYHAFFLDVNYMSSNMSKTLENGCRVSVKTTGYEDAYVQIVKEEFAKEGIIAKKAGGRSFVLTREDGLESSEGSNVLRLMAEVEESMNSGERLGGINGVLYKFLVETTSIGERIGLRVVDLIEETMWGREITSVRAKIVKGDKDLFNAVHVFSVREAHMNIVTGKGEVFEEYKTSLRKVMTGYNSALEDPKMTTAKTFEKIHTHLNKLLSRHVEHEVCKLAEKM